MSGLSPELEARIREHRSSGRLGHNGNDHARGPLANCEGCVVDVLFAEIDRLRDERRETQPRERQRTFDFIRSTAERRFGPLGDETAWEAFRSQGT